MTVFYSSSTDQEEAMPNLYPREPPRAAYSEMPFQGNMIYLHHSSPCIMDSHDSSNAAADLVAARFHENEMLLMQTAGGSANNDSHLSVLSGQNFSLSGSNLQGQGLSLSLCTQGTVPSFHHLPVRADISFSVQNQLSSVSDGPCKESLRIRNTQMDSLHSTLPYFTSSCLNFDYLKAAQELLNEVVNVRKALKLKGGKDQSLEADLGFKSSGAPLIARGDDNGCSTKELSASERLDFQNKAAKLMEMVDEVDRRYKQYYHQMQIIMSSFDVIAGAGAAKPYTMLALQTISRHFRCLRDAISAQIQSTRRKLGEVENGDSVRLCRLRHIDQQLRQQRIAQQYGVMQSHAWRPQRGLPENSVSILRAWLFEHFLHPYPKDSEKLMLARQTGLTRSQVSNWFINARVRLWKPMIEEMHKEELGDDTDMDSRSSPDKLQVDMEEGRQSAENGRPGHSGEPSKSNPLNDLDTSVSDAHYNHRPGDAKLSGEDDDGGGRIMAYQMAELGHYGGSMVSLTLGLQHWEANTGAYDFESMGGDRHHGCGPLHFIQDFAL